MIVDIGGGTSEVAVMSMGGVVVSRSLRVAGDEMDEDIVQYMRNKYNLLIGLRMAEQAKIAIGSAYHLPEEKTMVLRGRNLVTGLPEAIEVSSVEVREAMSSSVQTIIDTIKDALDEVPPEIIADLMETGICLAGGGAQLLALDRRLSDELKIRVWVAEDPMSCVARGAGHDPRRPGSPQPSARRFGARQHPARSHGVIPLSSPRLTHGWLDKSSLRLSTAWRMVTGFYWYNRPRQM